MRFHKIDSCFRYRKKNFECSLSLNRNSYFKPYNCLKIIRIRLEYLQLYNWFVLKTFNWSYNCLHINYNSFNSCWKNFLLFFPNILFYLYCLTLSRYLFSLHSFVNIFWFISSSCIIRLVCCFVLVFSSEHILACYSFLNIFACCRKLFTCHFSQISHPGFVFLFEFLWGTPILSQTSFALALISTFNSMMLPFGIFRNNLFTFRFLLWLFSSLGSWGMVMKTSFQSWFSLLFVFLRKKKSVSWCWGEWCFSFQYFTIKFGLGFLLFSI